MEDMTVHDRRTTFLAIAYTTWSTLCCVGLQAVGDAVHPRVEASSRRERLDRQWVPVKYLISLTVRGGISHLNGFEILILFYILYDRISKVSDWN